MIDLKLSEIAAAINGRLVGDDLLVTGSVETDSRLVKPGSLFVAKPGEVTDGHNFAGKAQESGAVALLVERVLDDVSIPQILVEDSVLALGLLAKFVLAEIRKQSGVQVIGVTGSNGKTTTKNMLRQVLSEIGETIAPIESYNNEVGAPYSILQTNLNTKFLVVELGAGGPGSIDYLAQIAKPDIGVVLKVGLAHVGEFGGIETTAQIKSELVRALGEDAVVVLNADDGYVADMAVLTQAKKIWFGTSSDADYQASDQQVSIDGTSFHLHWPDGVIAPVKLQILGEHHVMNALATLAVADVLGVPRDKAIAALEAMPLAERWRMQLTEGADGISYINDAYNASPDSTKAALQTLAQLGRQTGRRTVAIIGEMAELGEFSRQEHDAIGRLCVRLNLGLTIAIGEGARLVYMGASLEGSYDGEAQFLESLDGAFDVVRGMLRSGDIVLIKSSKSANLRHLGDQLAEAKA